VLGALVAPGDPISLLTLPPRPSPPVFHTPQLPLQRSHSASHPRPPRPQQQQQQGGNGSFTGHHHQQGGSHGGGGHQQQRPPMRTSSPGFPSSGSTGNLAGLAGMGMGGGSSGNLAGHAGMGIVGGSMGSGMGAGMGGDVMQAAMQAAMAAATSPLGYAGLDVGASSPHPYGPASPNPYGAQEQQLALLQLAALGQGHLQQLQQAQANQFAQQLLSGLYLGQ
jgi:hypothetical protein